MSWNILDKKLKSRLLLGSSGYPSPSHIQDSVESSGSEIVTVALRRSGGISGLSSGTEFWNLLKTLPVHILPNTAGCHSVKEAITTAQMAREIFDTNWIKLEITGDDYTLQPDPFGLVEASKELVKEGFEVFPYMTEDLVLAERLLNVGVKILMPWGSPIGSGQGLLNPYALRTMRNRFPEATLIVDAGIGCPSHAASAMEMGFDGVLLNSAVSGSQDPAVMAKAFSLAIDSGRLAYQAGMMEKRDFAKASTSVIGTPFWHQN